MSLNYGIKEIEEFKAPTRKPWLILLIVLVAGLAFWQITRAVKNRKARPASDKNVASSSVKEDSSGVTSKPGKQVETSSGSGSKEHSSAIKPPPVDLKVAANSGSKPAQSAKPKPGNLEPAAELEKAKQLYAKGNRVGARDVLLNALSVRMDKQVRLDTEALLSRVNMELALSPYAMPEKVDHVVMRGDSLDKISKKYGVTVQSIEIGNAVKNPDLIKAGDHLRVLDADFSVVVSKANHELLLLMNGKFFKRYKVGLGKFDKTPLGTFEIYDRIVEPVWWRPDGREIPFGHEENILGTRWMAIRATGETPQVRGYGIHGTWDEASIGKSESAGCVRMRNADVEELFNLLPLGTTVTIRP